MTIVNEANSCSREALYYKFPGGVCIDDALCGAISYPNPVAPNSGG